MACAVYFKATTFKVLMNINIYVGHSGEFQISRHDTTDQCMLAHLSISLIPRLSWGGGGGGEEREPGTDRSCMCLIYQHSDINVFLRYTFCIILSSFDRLWLFDRLQDMYRKRSTWSDVLTELDQHRRWSLAPVRHKL